MTMKDVKVCIDCVHLRLDGRKYVCTAQEAITQRFDLVLGEYELTSAKDMRGPKNKSGGPAGKCGPEGLLYVPKATAQEAAQEAQAIVEAAAPARPSIGQRLGHAGYVVAMAPVWATFAVGDAVADRWRGLKMGCSMFAMRWRAARLAWEHVADNAAPVAVVKLEAAPAEADPVQEAQAIEAGAAPVVNKEAAEAALVEANTAGLQAALQEAAKPEAEKPADGLAEYGPENGKPEEPKHEAAPQGPSAAQLAMIAGAVILAGFLTAAIFSEAARKPYARADVLGQLASDWKPCCHEVPMGTPCVRCRTGCAPRRERQQYATLH